MTEIKVPATSANLGPGYDTLGLALNLFNKFKIRKRSDQQLKSKILDKNNDREIKITDKDNLIVIAYQRYFDYIKQDLIGADIIEEMYTPLARGLGSSSSAIIGGLAAAAIVSENLISEKEFIQLAVELEKHPDNVIPALVGGLTINYNCEDIYNYYKINIENTLKFVLVVPDFELKTEKLRQVLPNKLDYAKVISNLSRISLLTTAFINREYNLLKVAMEDQMHQPFRKELIKEFDQLINTAYQHGAYGAALSGAGPTIIAVTEKNSKIIAAKMKEVFTKNNINADTFIINAYNNNLYKILKKEAAAYD